MVTLPIPKNLAVACGDDGRRGWLKGLPAEIEEIAARWALTLAAPFEPGGVTAWVAPALSREFGEVVLKVGWRHLEGEDEAAGLREWRGDGAVRLHADERLSPTTAALLLERCRPGTTLAARPENEQDAVLAALLRRLWRPPSGGEAFRPLQELADYWADCFERKIAKGQSTGFDDSLVRDGVALYRSLPASSPDEVLLCTDLHAQNVLAATREPWLVIDPKPFVGDPTYDALQHLFNCEDRLTADPRALVTRFAGLLGLDPERLGLWLFGYCVVQSVDFPWTLEVARQIRP